MTIGKGNIYRYIIINPGTRAFESRNPGALYVALSRAKTAGSDSDLPDFAWHPNVLINADRICHIVNTALARARNMEVRRISQISKQTLNKFQYLLHATEE